MTGAPCAPLDKLRSLTPDARRLVRPELLETHRACPIQREGGVLHMAMLNPRDTVAIREIERHTGLKVEPWVTSEYRLYQALERYYKIRPEGLRALSLAPPAEMRRQRLAESGPEPEAEPPAEPEPTPSPWPTAEGVSTEGAAAADAGPELGLDGLPLDADFDYEAHLLMPGGSELEGGDAGAASAPATPAAATPAPATVPVSPAPGETPEAGDRLGALDDALAGGPDRDAIARALLDFCTQHAARAGLFVVGKNGIRGIAGRGRGMDDPAVRAVELAGRGATVLHSALLSREFFFGAVPALPPNRELYQSLGGTLPPTALVLPLQVKDRSVALLYLDDDERAMTQPDIALMRRVARKAGMALELLILRNKLRAI